MLVNGAVLVEDLRDKIIINEESPVLSAIFKCAVPFLPGEGPIDTQKLYVLETEEAKAAALRFPNAWFAAVQENLEEDLISMDNVLVIRTELSRDDVFTAMVNRHLKIVEWMDDMKDAIQFGASLQELIDISEPLIGEFISVSDYAFRLLAYTRHIHTDCEISNYLIENGTHSQQTIDSFIEHNELDFWMKNEFYVNTDLRYLPYATAGFVFRFGNRYFNHAVMTFSTPYPKKNAVWLFKMFGESVKPVVMKDWEKTELFTHIYDRLITDIVRGKSESADTIRYRAEYAKIPFEGNILLSVIPVSPNGDHSIGRVGNEVSCLSPQTYVSAVDEELIYIEYLEDKNLSDNIEKCCKKLKPLLESYSLRCGTSCVFHNLGQMHTAYLQAKEALFICESAGLKNCELQENCVKDECTFGSFGPVVTYDSVFEYALCNCTSEKMKMVRQTKYYEKLKSLYEYDRVHHMNNLQLLRVYLENERRIGDTADRMHMHRNNIGYRLQKINELTGLDLEDRRVRTGLLLTYMLLNQTCDFWK